MAGGALQLFRDDNGLLPILFLLINFKQEVKRRFGVMGVFELEEQLFSAVQQPRFQKILCKFKKRHGLLFGAQVCAPGQILMHAYGALHLAASTKQAAQRKMQFYGLRINLDHFDKGFDGFVGLLIHQKIQSPEVRGRQHPRFRQQVAYINARGHPAQREERGQRQQPPVFDIHDGQR